MAAHSVLQRNLQTEPGISGDSTMCQPRGAASNRTRNRESNLAVHRDDNHTRNNGVGRKDRAMEAGLEDGIDDSASYNSAEAVEPARGRDQEMARIENTDVLFSDVVGRQEILGMVDSSSQIGSPTGSPSTLELSKSTGSVLGLADIAPGDQTKIKKSGEQDVMNPRDGLHSPSRIRRTHTIGHTSSMRKEAVESGEPIEYLSEVAVQTLSSQPGIDLVPDCHGSAGVIAEAGHLSVADETGASAHSCQTTRVYVPMIVAAEGIAEDRMSIKAFNADGGENVSQDRRDLRYRPGGADGRHTGDATFHPLERLRRSRMPGHPRVVFRFARGLVDAVGSGATDLDIDIEMQDTGDTDGGDGRSQTPIDTDSNSDGGDSGSGINDVDDSRSTSSASSDAAPASREDSSRRRRHHRSRRHRRFNHMNRFERVIRLLCLVIGGIVAIINVVLLFMPTDWNGNVVAGDHRQIAKRFSHVATLFIL